MGSDSIDYSEMYLLTCYRYIEMNPVRAGMVDHPSDYPWSSYACNAVGKANSMLSPHDLYLQLGDNDAARQSSYRGLFDAQLETRASALMRIDPFLLTKLTHPPRNSIFYSVL